MWKVGLFVLFGSAFSNAFDPLFRPWVSGLGIFLLGLLVWPEARRNPAPPLAKYFAPQGQLSFARYVIFYAAFALALGAAFAWLIQGHAAGVR